jgi:flotillin
VLAKYKAEAEGVRKVLDAKAEGYRALVESCRGDAKSAATLLLVEKIENLVAHQVEAIKNLKIDKITVWDSGASDGKSSTAGFVSNLIKSLPPLHELAGMAGVELPGYLGKMVDGEEARPEPHVTPRRPPSSPPPRTPFGPATR